MLSNNMSRKKIRDLTQVRDDHERQSEEYRIQRQTVRTLDDRIDTGRNPRNSRHRMAE